MATELENLKTRRATITARLAALTDGTGIGDKPNANGGQAVDHVGYKDGLYRELAEINKLIAHLIATDVDSGGGPWEVDEFFI